MFDFLVTPDSILGILSRRLLVPILVPFMMVGLVAAPALGQAGGANVGGVVTDESGGRLPGVTVRVRNVATGDERVLVTGPEGNYRAVALRPGPYEITAELAGFATIRREITLNVGINATADLTLGMAGVSEQVTVTAEVPLIELEKSEPKSVVSAQEVQELPVLSRSFLELAQILPGSGPDNSRSRAFMVTKFGGVADQRNGFTTVIDGGAIDDDIWGATLMNVSQDAVQEFTVHRNRFDAQYGAALSAVVDVVTKSGTNQLSGSAFYFGRDDKLNTKDHFADEKPPFEQFRAGGTLGGPIVPNRTHFFGSFEYNDINTNRIIALPPSNPLSVTENGIFPSGVSDKMALAKVDHRLNDDHSLSLRYAYDNQFFLRELNTSSDSRQVDERNRTHSLIASENWIVSQNKVNTLRFHYLYQWLGLLAHSDETTISRPQGSTGSAVHAPQFFPRTNISLHDTLYIDTPRHSLKVGGEVKYFTGEHESHWNDQGQFNFFTNAPFDPDNSATWPSVFSIQETATWNFNSWILGFYVQDDWEASDRVRVNLGLRYDLDTNLRNNDFYYGLIDDPAFTGIDNFISQDRGNDLNNIQPRLGFTWDLSGDGTVVLRGGYGIYVTRNRPWLQLTSQDLSKSVAVRIEDPDRLRFYPDIDAVLGGQTPAQLLASGGGSRSLFLISDDYILPVSHNTTFGLGWQVNPTTSFTVDFIHNYGKDQLGSTDRNLPPSGPISAGNPRPVSTFNRASILENFTLSWYTGLETQLKTQLPGVNSLLVSYTLSRNYRDGVHFYSTFRGTQRTPDARGYNENDQRHNFTYAMTVRLPWDVQVSSIGKFISGSPMSVQAGFDIDGDLSTTNDRPPGLRQSVGRELVDESFNIVNDLRGSRGLSPIDRELLNLDPYISVDLRLSKRVTFDRGALEFLIEAFNITNHVNFEPFAVNHNIISPDFLVRRSARPMRQVQWGVRFRF